MIKKIVILFILILIIFSISIYFFQSKIETQIFNKIINKIEQNIDAKLQYNLSELNLLSGIVKLENLKIIYNNQDKNIMIKNLEVLSKKTLFNFIKNKKELILDLNLKNIELTGEKNIDIKSFFEKNKELRLNITGKDLLSKNKNILIHTNNIKYQTALNKSLIISTVTEVLDIDLRFDSKGFYIKKLNIGNSRALLRDMAKVPVNSIELSDIQIEAQDIFLNSDKYADIKYFFRLRETQGKVEGKGKIIPDFDVFNFNLNTNIYTVPINYFESYYRDKIDIKILSGLVSIESHGECKNNELYFRQRAIIRDLEISEPDSGNVLFGMNKRDVVSALKNKDNTLKFSFKITGDIKDPKFKPNIKIQDAISVAMKVQLGNILNVLENPVEGAVSTKDQIKNIGKNLLMGILSSSKE